MIVSRENAKGTNISSKFRRRFSIVNFNWKLYKKIADQFLHRNIEKKRIQNYVDTKTLPFLLQAANFLSNYSLKLVIILNEKEKTENPLHYFFFRRCCNRTIIPCEILESTVQHIFVHIHEHTINVLSFSFASIFHIFYCNQWAFIFIMHLYTSVLKVKYIAKSNEEERAGGRCLQNFFSIFWKSIINYIWSQRWNAINMEIMLRKLPPISNIIGSMGRHQCPLEMGFYKPKNCLWHNGPIYYSAIRSTSKAHLQYVLTFIHSFLLLCSCHKYIQVSATFSQYFSERIDKKHTSKWLIWFKISKESPIRKVCNFSQIRHRKIVAIWFNDNRFLVNSMRCRFETLALFRFILVLKFQPCTKSAHSLTTAENGLDSTSGIQRRLSRFSMNMF